MTTESRIASFFGLDDMGWAKHANPWSGWTRFITCLPLFALGSELINGISLWTGL